jgi:diguanylate cyclase (GGDEF)-like protein
MVLFQELDSKKQKVFQVILAFTSVAGTGFALINSYRGQIDLAVVEFIVAAISFWLLINLNKTESIAQFKRLALIYVLVFFSIMMFAISREGVSITIFAWVLVIPLASYLLLGVKSGFIITAVYYSIATILFFGGFTGHPVLEEKVAYANIIVCALLFWGVSHSYENTSQKVKKKLRKLAVSDHLTGLYNRTMMNQLFAMTVSQAKQNNDKVSLVLFDLDSFKSINDQFGHDIGDQVLINFARIIQRAVAEIGYAFRIGGEEFAIIFSSDSDLVVLSLAENVRRSTEKLTINGVSAELSISVSAGVVTAYPDAADLNDLMMTADRRMYHGKNQGRNVVIHKG